MNQRREGRMAAVQLLFHLDVNDTPLDKALVDFWPLWGSEKSITASPKVRSFAEELVEGVIAHRPEIDKLIQSSTVNYELHRVAIVDRNVLRVALFEMLYTPDLPAAIIINEALEIARALGEEKSTSFVNGVLDRVKRDLGRVSHAPVGATSKDDYRPPVKSKTKAAPDSATKAAAEPRAEPLVD